MKAIPGYENYLINEDGTKVFNTRFNRYLKILKIIHHHKTRDYVQLLVCLYKNGKAKTCGINRLIYTTFNGEIPSGFDVDHIDNDPQNNHYSNLQLLSHQENVKKCFKDDPTLKDRLSEGKIGEKNPMYGKHHSESGKQKMSDGNKGRVWINNGMVNKFVKITDIPTGFVRGMLKKALNE